MQIRDQLSVQKLQWNVQPFYRNVGGHARAMHAIGELR